jgi:raffinose/stachyose/melibiose transport system substrate-binding protein
MKRNSLTLLGVFLWGFFILISLNAAGPVKLEFFVQQATRYDVFKTLVDDFNKKNPGIVIETNNAPEPEKVLQTRVMSNSVPDIISTWSSAADFKLYATEGYWLDLTSQSFLKKVNQGFLKSLTINGKDYSLPYSYTGVGIYYNKKIFSANNLKPPATYSELINLCRTLKAKGITPLSFGDMSDWTHGKLNMPMYIVTIPNWQRFFSDLADGKTTAEANPSYRKLGERILELRQYGQADTLGTNSATSYTMFATGQSAMLIQGTWSLPAFLKANPQLETEMIPFPGDTPDSYVFAITIDTSLAISAEVKNREAALAFLDYLANLEIASKYADMSDSLMLIGGIPARNVQFKPVIDAYEKGKVAPWPQDLWPASVVPENYKVVQKLVSTKDIDQFIKDTNRIFREAKQ